MKAAPFLVIATPLLVAPGQPKPIAQAEIEARYSAEFGECLKDGLATADTVFCVTTEAGQQESRLDRALAAALKRVSARRRPALRSAQAKWEEQSRAKCDAAVAGEPFERVADAERGQCLLDETIRRTIEIERIR